MKSSGWKKLPDEQLCQVCGGKAVTGVLAQEEKDGSIRITLAARHDECKWMFVLDLEEETTMPHLFRMKTDCQIFPGHEDDIVYYDCKKTNCNHEPEP